MDIEEKNMKKFAEQIKGSLSNNFLVNIKSPKNFEDSNIFYDECLYIFDFRSKKIIYNRGFEKLLGYKDHEITFDIIFGNIHPNDIDIVSRVIRACVVYCLENPKNSSNNLLTIKYRRKKKNGSYIHILSQSSIYERNENGEISKSLARLTDISFMDNKENIRWSFEASNLNKAAFRKQINRVYANFFTKREIQIIFEMKKQITNFLIGENLNISEFTVASHRKNIFRKSNCHNTDELLSFCKEIGILN